MTILAGDHYSIELVNQIADYCKEHTIEFTNVGVISANTKVKLQDIVPKVAESVRSGGADSGILICGTGAGVEIGANRFKGVRASLCVDPKQAEYAKVYDNANVLCLSSWLTKDPAKILDAWFNNEFDGNEGRARMLEDFDEWR